MIPVALAIAEVCAFLTLGLLFGYMAGFMDGISRK